MLGLPQPELSIYHLGKENPTEIWHCCNCKYFFCKSGVAVKAPVQCVLVKQIDPEEHASTTKSGVRTIKTGENVILL